MNEEFLSKVDEKGRPVIGFTRIQLTVLVTMVMLLAVFGATYGSQLLIDTVSPDEVDQALIAECILIKESIQRQADRTNLSREAWRAQRSAYAALRASIPSGSLDTGPAAILSAALTDSIDSLQALLDESKEPIPVPNCDELRNNLNGG